MAIIGEVAELAILLKLKDELSGPLKHASSQLSGLDKQQGLISQGAYKMGAGIGNVIKSVAALSVVAGTAIAGGVVTAFQQGVQKAEEMGLAVEKLTGVTGLGAIQASQLIQVFDKFGISSGTVVTRLGFLEKTLGLLNVTSAKGANKLAELDKATGLHLLSNKGKVVDVSVALGQLSDYMNSNASASAKAAAAAKLLGRGYVDMIPVLKLGSKGIAEVAAEAARMGETLNSAADVTNVHNFITAERNAKEAIGGLELQLGLLVMPDLTEGLNAFTSYLETHKTEVQAFFKDALNTARGLAHTLITDVVPAVQQAIGVIGTIFGAIKTAWGALPDPVKQLLIGGFVVNKLSGGLLASGGKDLLLGLLGKGGGALGGGGGGGILGGLGIQHVWVDNMGAGGMGGGPGGVAETAGKGSLLLGGLAVAGIALGTKEAVDEAVTFHDQRMGIASANKLTNAQALAIQLSQMTPDQRQMSMSHGAGTAFMNEKTTYAAALAGAQAAISGAAPNVLSNLPVASRPSSALPNMLANRALTIPNSFGLVLSRALAAGFHPSVADVKSTMARNAARAAASAAAIRAAAADTAAAIRAKQFVAYNEFKAGILNNPSLNVTTTLSVRDSSKATIQRGRYGNTPAQNGAM